MPTRAGRGFADDTNESIGYLLRDASRRILGAMTLDALEKVALIERVRSTTDRRKVGVMLTPAGNALRDTLLGYAATVLDRALAGLSPAEIATMRAALQRIKGNV